MSVFGRCAVLFYGWMPELQSEATHHLLFHSWGDVFISHLVMHGLHTDQDVTSLLPLICLHWRPEIRNTHWWWERICRIYSCKHWVCLHLLGVVLLSSIILSASNFLLLRRRHTRCISYLQYLSLSIVHLPPHHSHAWLPVLPVAPRISPGTVTWGSHSFLSSSSAVTLVHRALPWLAPTLRATCILPPPPNENLSTPTIWCGNLARTQLSLGAGRQLEVLTAEHAILLSSCWKFLSYCF
jgi:hypothetical protein